MAIAHETIRRPHGPGCADGLSLHEKIDVCRGVFAALVVMAHSVEISWGVHRDAVARMPRPSVKAEMTAICCSRERIFMGPIHAVVGSARCPF